MARIIRRAIGNKKRGAALIAALQLITLILIGFLSLFGGPHSAKKAPAETGVSAPVALTDQTQTDQASASTTTAPIPAKDLTEANKAELRNSAHFGKKLQEPLNTQVFNVITARAAQAHNPDLPNDVTLTTDHQDYPPYSYVYFLGTGFQPGETVDMLVA